MFTTLSCLNSESRRREEPGDWGDEESRED